MGWCNDPTENPCYDRACPVYTRLKNVSSATLCICGVEKTPGNSFTLAELTDAGCECHEMIRVYLAEGRLQLVNI